jgi:hypothetical protein
VTIASATSGTVRETRAIVLPTFSTVERPTSRSISVPLTASRIGVFAPLAGAPGANACGDCATGEATKTTMMYTTSAAKKAAGRRLGCRDRQN